jgi:hypothetical protein
MPNPETKKGSAFLIISLAALFVIILVLFIPLPHYFPDGTTSSGPSIIAQLLGEKSEGESIISVWSKNLTGRVESPYTLTCQTDLDCQTVTVRNQCQSYCANFDPNNSDVTEKLERNRVCDPASYAPRDLGCKCVLGSCTDL